MVVYFVYHSMIQYIPITNKSINCISNRKIYTIEMQQNLQANSMAGQCTVATTLFDLFLKYTQTTLYLRLCNYGQGSVYQKNYSEEHVGDQIHQKVELSDIVVAVKESKICNIYANKRQNQNQIDESQDVALKQYNYGDKFESKFSILSVFQNGRIMTQTKISKNGIQHIYDSWLQLQKIIKNQIIQCFSMIERYGIQQKWVNKYKQLEKKLEDKEKQWSEIKNTQVLSRNQISQSTLTTQCPNSSSKEKENQTNLPQFISDINSNFVLKGNVLTLQQLQNLTQFLQKIDFRQINEIVIKIMDKQSQKQSQQSRKNQGKQNQQIKQQVSSFTQSQLKQIQEDNLISNYKPNLSPQYFSSNPQIQKLKTKIKYLQQRINEHQNNETQQNNRILRYKAFLPKAIIDMIEPQKCQDESNGGSNNKKIVEQANEPLNRQFDQQFQLEIKKTIDQYLLRKSLRRKSNQANDNDILVRGSHEQLNSTTESLNSLFDSGSPYYKWFKITGNVIHYVGGQGIQNLFGSWCQLLINQAIPSHSPYCFSFKIVKTDRRGIVIGVVDRKKQRNNKNPTEGNAIGYYGRWGKLTPNGTEQGTGFSQGETVKVSVNLHAHTIKWSVHNQTRAKIKNGILGDPNRQFVPYIEMRHTGDQIMWMGSSKTFASKISE